MYEGMEHRRRAMGALVIVVWIVVAAGCSRAVLLPPQDRGFRSEHEFLAKAMDRVYPALVRLDVVVAEPAEGRMRKQPEAGSGVIISREGHIITNHHVAGNATRIVCRMPDGEETEARLVGTDPLADIAVVQLDLAGLKAGRTLAAAEFGDSDEVRVGDAVFAMGSPAALSQSVTKGIVSNAAMILPRGLDDGDFRLEGEDVGSLVRWIGHDAGIYPGNSGGPLVNAAGLIIGINEVGIGSLGGAIPGNLARSVALQIVRTGTVERSWTGLEVQPRLKDGPTRSGVLVGGVIQDSPADQAGIRPGDILAQFDGVNVDCRIDEDLPVFNQLVMSTPVGKTVALTIVREGRPMERTLTTRPRDKARAQAQELKAWGVTVRDFTLLSALEYRRPDRRGVLVGTVRRGGPADSAKPALEPGDVIAAVEHKRIDTVADLQVLTEDLTGGGESRVPVVVEFERGGDKVMTVVKIGSEPDQDKPRMSRKAWFPARTQVLTRDLAKAVGLEGRSGVRVVQVFPGHSADQAGIVVGDILLQIDGEPIRASNTEDHEVFSEMIRQYDIGAQVVLDRIHEGEPNQVKVLLEPPMEAASELKRIQDDYFELTLRQLAFEDKVHQQVSEETQGVLVETVAPAGWAALAGLQPGDIVLSVNGHASPDVDVAQGLLRQAEADRAKTVVFFVRRGVHTLFVGVEPSWPPPVSTPQPADPMERTQ